MNKTAVVLLLLIPLAVAGCGSNAPSACFITGINVFPQAATADHAAASPGNTQQFAAFQSSAPSGCAFAQVNLQNAVWKVSDPVNATIGNQAGVDYGKATCINAAASPITVTATVPSGNGSNVSATATLTCN